MAIGIDAETIGASPASRRDQIGAALSMCALGWPMSKKYQFIVRSRRDILKFKIVVCLFIMINLENPTHSFAAMSDAAVRDWFFFKSSGVQKDEPSKLVYGKPDTGDVDVVLWCLAGEHAYLFDAALGDGDSALGLEIQSGGKTYSHLPVERHAYIEGVRIGWFTPFAFALGSTGSVAFRRDGGRIVRVSPHSAKGKRAVSQFFEDCR